MPDESFPRIVHFTGGGKPWHTNSRHPFRWDYWSFRRKTPFRSFLPDDFGPRELARAVVPHAWRAPVKRLLAPLIRSVERSD
jgi:lipopolysaccharide biosynthesis glycosyltransferase